MSKKVSIILPYYNRKKHILNTLESFNYFYGHNYKDLLEIVIVDDASDKEHRIDDLLDFNLNLKLINLKNKNGINPCYPYNVGVRESSGDIIILSSPETFHSTNIFKITNNFEKLNINTYLLFSVFCVTDLTLIDNLFDDFNNNIESFNKNEILFKQNLGEFGYPFNNKYGSWYLHSQIRPSGLNFFTAITKKKYYEISGFDERFRFGTGYDDDEFRDRLIESGSNFIYYDDALGIHVNHEIVNNHPPTTNNILYQETKVNKYLKNDLWGRH
jgi:glycosyltransferase involved in cell wall biosynthesis